MKKGKSVMIYQDPISRNKKEGMAKLVHKLWEAPQYEGGYKIESWKVRFPGDQRLFIRTIRVDIKEQEIAA